MTTQFCCCSCKITIDIAIKMTTKPSSGLDLAGGLAAEDGK